VIGVNTKLHKIKNMKYSFLVVVIIFAFTACSNQEKVAPAAPTTAAAALTGLQGKTYKVEKMGLLSRFKMDTINPVNWDIKDTSSFYKNYAKSQSGLVFTFSKDSAVNFLNPDGSSFFNPGPAKMIKAIFTTDNDAKLQNDEEKPGIKLRIVYNDSLDFGGTKTASKMTQSFLIRGMNEKELIVETGNAFNEQKVVLWMKAD
jgi:hypothetical protein